VLSQLKGSVDEDVASNAELQAKLAITDSKNRGFRKSPDKPLSEVIRRKTARTRQREILGAAKK